MSKVHMRTARDTIANPSGIIQLEFLRTTSQLLRDAVLSDEAEINSIRQELALLEKAKLRIHRRGDRSYFAALSEGEERERSLHKDMARIHALARRTYLQKRLALIERNSRRLRTALSSYESACYDLQLQSKLTRFCGSGLDLSRILYTEEQNEWIDRPYSPNPYYQGSLKYQTEHGIPVRSMSEARFGSRLEAIGLPYRSDDLVTIHSEFNDSPFRENYFADFKIPNLCGGITIHEHLGALHLKDYPDNSLKRLNDYHNFSIYELPDRPVKHSEITWSFEPDIRDPKLLRSVIRRILLPSLSEY